jgi:hypothetical protein
MIRRLRSNLRTRLRRWFSRRPAPRGDPFERRRIWRKVTPRDEGGDRRLTFWERHEAERDRERGYVISRERRF